MVQASCWLHEYAVPSKRNAMVDKPIKLYTQMKLRTQMQPHTILLRPSETLHDGTKNGRTTNPYRVNISPCSKKKKKQNVPLAEEEEEVQQLEVGEFRKKKPQL